MGWGWGLSAVKEQTHVLTMIIVILSVEQIAKDTRSRKSTVIASTIIPMQNEM